jgi:hypothetical protein
MLEVRLNKQVEEAVNALRDIEEFSSKTHELASYVLHHMDYVLDLKLIPEVDFLRDAAEKKLCFYRKRRISFTNDINDTAMTLIVSAPMTRKTSNNSSISSTTQASSKEEEKEDDKETKANGVKITKKAFDVKYGGKKIFERFKCGDISLSISFKCGMSLIHG